MDLRESFLTEDEKTIFRDTISNEASEEELRQLAGHNKI